MVDWDNKNLTQWQKVSRMIKELLPAYFSPQAERDWDEAWNGIEHRIDELEKKIEKLVRKGGM